MTRIVTVHGTITRVLEPPDELIERMSRAPGDWSKTFLTVTRWRGWKVGPASRVVDGVDFAWILLSDIVRIEETP